MGLPLAQYTGDLIGLLCQVAAHLCGSSLEDLKAAAVGTYQVVAVLTYALPWSYIMDQGI